MHRTVHHRRALYALSATLTTVALALGACGSGGSSNELASIPSPAASSASISSGSDNGSATLPDSMLESTLGDLKVGEKAMTTPWAVWFDMKGKGHLHPQYPAVSVDEAKAEFAARNGNYTVTMLVERRADGYHIWVPAGEQYQRQDKPGYVGGENLKYIPVVKVHSGS